MEMETPDFGALVSTLLDGKAAELQAFLTPVLVLICWTLVMWLWMYVTRIPAMQKAGVDPDSARHPGTYGDKLPANVRAVADNYNHLHEQPTIFYALMFFAALTGGGDNVMSYLAYGYVALRIVHTFVQVLSPKALLRFIMFNVCSLVLVIMVGKEVIRVFL